MKRYILIFLFLPPLLATQTKPRTPIVPSGSWATDLVRAFAFSPADSVMVDSVKDWSSYGSWPICSTFDAASWQADGAESPRYEFSGGTANNTTIIENMRLIRTPTDTGGFKSFTSKMTVALRIRITTAGGVSGPFSFTNAALTPDNSIRFDNVDLDGSANHWCKDAATCLAWDLGTGAAFKTTMILTYAGDSLRAYQDGSFKGATVATGDISDWGGKLCTTSWLVITCRWLV